MQTQHFERDAALDVFAPTGFDRFFRRSVIGSRILSRILSRVELPDTVELPLDRPAIIAANHSSLFDLIASLITLGNYGVTARLAVNSRFFDNAVAGWFLRRLGCIPFSRDDRESAEETMVEALKAGQVCAMMPEGRITRIDDQIDGVGGGRPGVSRIARRAGAAVVPVGFARSERAWKPGRPFPRIANFGSPVVARIGPPILFTSDDHQCNADELMAAISALVLEARQVASAQ